MRHLDDIVRAVADTMKIDAEQAERRKSFLQFADRDQELLRDLDERLGRERLEFIDEFYEHLLAFDETRQLIADPATLQRLKHTQAVYFERLTAGTYDWSYVADRLRVGVAHQRAGLEAQWYLGAYRMYLRWLLPAVRRLYAGEPQRALDTFQALLKVVFLDMGLAIDTYIHADREALVATKAYAEQVLGTVPSGLLVLGEDLRVVLVNRSFREAFGVASREVLGRPVSDVLPVGGLREHALEVMSTGENRHSLPFELRGPEGEPRPLRITIAGVRLAEEEEEEARLLLVVEDLTEEERLRARARASELRFREVVEQATDGIVMMGADGIVSYFNRAAEKMFGYGRDEVIGRPVTMLMPEKFREPHDRGVQRYLAAGQSSTLGTVRQIEGLHKDGTTIPIECMISACRIDGDVVFTGMLRDISERLSAEEAVKRSERSFRTLIEQTPDAMAVHRAGRFVYVNPAMVSLLGYESQADLIGEPVSMTVHPEDREAVAERVRKMMAAGEIESPREERFLRKDGSVIYAEVAGMPLEYQGEPAIVAVGRDLTERKELTARMMQMDRMIAAGTLAAGVGHEINNPLTYVSANVSFALEELAELSACLDATAAELHRRYGERVAEEILDAGRADRARKALADLREVLGDAREGGDRIRDIVRDLKTFSRGDDEKREPLQVHRVLGSAIDMAFNEIRHRARLVKDYQELPPVLANASRLGQVFLNLLVNAAHAIEEGAAERNEIRVCTALRDGHVVIEVRDTGRGIAAEDLPKLFDPFFTTKPIGQGTGLGLFICRQIIDGHSGHIEVDSEPGRGSVFRVLLPPAPEGEERVPPERRRDEGASASPPARILAIDDEPMVGRTIARALGREHVVAAVTSARAALDRLEVGERYDLLFCDLMMPDMSGMEFYEELLGRDRSLARRVVFLTGGAFTPRAREFLERVPNLHIDKPFSAKNLRALVRDLLGARTSSPRGKSVG